MVTCADYLFYCLCFDAKPICAVFSFRYFFLLNAFGYFREVWLALFSSSSHRLQFGINGSCLYMLMINLLPIHMYFNWLVVSMMQSHRWQSEQMASGAFSLWASTCVVPPFKVPLYDFFASWSLNTNSYCTIDQGTYSNPPTAASKISPACPHRLCCWNPGPCSLH